MSDAQSSFVLRPTCQFYFSLLTLTQQQQDIRRSSSRRNRRARTMPGHYSFMTKITKINAIHDDLNVRIYQGKMLTLESIDISHLQKGRKHMFFERLRSFQTHIIGIEHELRNV
jgi:hypothetical protein